MPKTVPSSPLEEPVFMTGIGFDFLPEHVVLSIQYPAEFGDIHGPKKEAQFLVENGSLRAIGAKLIEVAGIVEKPRGSA
jgi:hypothetical protein